METSSKGLELGLILPSVWYQTQAVFVAGWLVDMFVYLLVRRTEKIKSSYGCFLL